ncbi:hypothetical protein OS493_031705 [Desmophyllum pertusum]|uniref:Uncharacterized protein n=1 Tax=Desmophyllum pertusum TaxID=174260 RepID=A0A9W9ZKC4_9CNID|nr:hypothetical protein OS493_031705 [Desmophyllum pertusum]
MLVLLCLFVILSSQVDANLLDPTLIGRELQKFAKDALGVDEMQISGSASPNPVHLDEGVFNEMKDILKTYPFIKWQYFGSEKGVMASYPVFDDKEKCDKFDNRYRPWYVETATPEAKDVVLVIDISASMTGEKLYIAKEAAKQCWTP